jgi:hypothetical protein
MALAIKFQEIIDRGEVRDYSDVARLGYVSRARVSQIMNLLLLAPDIQEYVLLGLESQASCSEVSEHELRHVASIVHWPDQRERVRDRFGILLKPHLR